MNTSSSSDDHVADIVFCVLNGVGLLVCLVAAILVVALRLHKKIVYRLCLYQVLAGIAFATVQTLQIVFLNYDDKSPRVYARLCIAIGFLVLYTQWIKVFFATCATFHLFCFAILYKNLKKLEALYVVTSLLVPALFAIVPLITHSYHYAPPACFINKDNNTETQIAEIERLALWNVPAMVILFVASIAMVVMVTILTFRVKREPIKDGDQFWKALKQLLPLAAFPILFLIFVIPELIYGINVSTSSTVNDGVVLATSVFVAMWGIASGAVVIIHISVARLCCRNKRKRPLDAVHVDGSKQPLLSNDHTMKQESFVNVNMSSSITHFSLPEESNAAENNM